MMSYLYLENVACRACGKAFVTGVNRKLSAAVLSGVQCRDCFNQQSIAVDCVIEDRWGKAKGSLRFMPSTGIDGVINFVVLEFFDNNEDVSGEYKVVLERTGIEISGGTLTTHEIREGDRLILKKVAAASP